MIKNLVNSEAVFNTFINLYGRWQDEKEYEDFNDYVKVMQTSVEKVVGKITNVKGTKKPFGLKFTTSDGREVSLYLKFKGRYCNLAAKVIK